MNKITVVFTAILVLICFLVLGSVLVFGGGFIVFYTYDGGVMDLLYNVMLSLIGVTLAIAVVPQLISSFVQMLRRRGGKADFLFSLGYVAVGALLVCFTIGTLIILISGGRVFDQIREVLYDMGTPMDSDTYNMLLERFEQLMRLPRIVIVPLSLYLIIAPMIRTFRSEQKALLYRVELYKALLGALMLFLTAFAAVIWHMEDDFAGIIIEVLGCIMGMLAIAYFIAALAGLSKAIKRQKEKCGREAAPEPQQDELPGDLPFDLPAGVSAQDFQ